MTEKYFDNLFPQEKVKSSESRGYVWKVIVDPTRGAEDPGMFFGRLFRMVDIRLNRDEKSTWPEGIVFEHAISGCRLTYKDGLLVDLTTSKVIMKKPRIRDRNSKPKYQNISKGGSMTKEQNLLSSKNQMRRFTLIRTEDLTGVSGIGEVAEGTLFSSGQVVVHWLREPFAIGLYQSLEDVVRVHGHEGRSQLHFID
jgi:hypothetical protein